MNLVWRFWKRWRWVRCHKIALEGTPKIPIYVQCSLDVTIEEVRATACDFKKHHGKIAMIAVNYLEIMKMLQSNSQCNFYSQVNSLRYELMFHDVLINDKSDNNWKATVLTLKMSIIRCGCCRVFMTWTSWQDATKSYSTILYQS